ncbi:MAG: nucleotidyltransferase [Oscillospiraceae bacterium]|nr:nucleotidyltransferase [Oscillospiraceae bacterium]
MNITAIIAEFNPFHNGHRYLIDKARANGATHIVAVMSGNFVQRGSPAIFDKFTRAKTALLNGVDLVLEMPLHISLSSAEMFGEGSVSLINSLGCVNSLCFGAECDDVSQLENIADTLLYDEFNKKIKEELSTGVSYPTARETVITNIMGGCYNDIISKPNNILAIEYIKAMKKIGANISPMLIKRVGVSHNSSDVFDNFASATTLREMLENGNNIERYIPSSAFDIYNSADIHSLKYTENAFLSKLRTMNESDFLALSDVSEGLEKRIISAIASSTSLTELYDKIKTKRYTHSRIRRIIMCAYLSLTKGRFPLDIGFARVLAFNQKGAEIMSIAKKSGSVPLISSLADVKKIGELQNSYAEWLSQTTDLYNLMKNSPDICGTDYRKKPFIV